MIQDPVIKNLELLWVEDSWGDVFLLREAFRRSGLPVNLNIVTDGEEALAYLNKESEYEEFPKPDLILLDLNLPMMDGRAFLRRIKSQPEFKSLPVVVLTSSRLETDIREVLSMEAQDYLLKPVDLKGFDEIVQRLWEIWKGLGKGEFPKLSKG